MIHKIDWVEVKKTQTGKEYKKATIGGETVSVWPDFAHYDEVQAGREVEGIIQTKGDYKNLVADVFKGGLGRSSGAKQAAEVTSRSVEKSQAVKVDSIKSAGSARDATLIVTTFYPELSGLRTEEKEQEIKATWEYWRKYFYGKLDEPFV